MDFVVEHILLAFLLLTFLQSGYDKTFDWKGNVTWLKLHFANTFLANKIPFCLAIILILEWIASILAVLGMVYLWQHGTKHFALWCGLISCLTLFLLLFGQRVAKDYDGARTIIIYFIPTIFLVYLLQ